MVRHKRDYRNEQDEPSNKMLLPKIAAGLGVGYVAYRNRNNIVRGVKSVLTSTQVSINRTASGTKFKGAVGEAKNLSKAFDEIYDLSPTGIARTIKVGGRTEELGSRVGKYNESLKRRLGQSPLTDTKQSMNLLQSIKTGSNRKDAVSYANLKNLDDILTAKDSKYKDLFGENLAAASHIMKHNSSTVFQKQRVGKLGSKDSGVNTQVLDLINAYSSEVSDKNIKLQFGNDGEKKNFMEKILTVAEETRRRTGKQQTEFYKRSQEGYGSTGKNNHFSQAMDLLDMTKFKAVSDIHAPKSDDFTKRMLQNGWSPVTMNQARANKVREAGNGRRYMIDSAEDLPALQKVYSRNLRESIPLSGSNKALTSSRDQLLADDYLNIGRRYGLKEEELGDHLFSPGLFANTKTGELLDTNAAGEFWEEGLDTFIDNVKVPFVHFNPLQFSKRRQMRGSGKTNHYFALAGKDYQSFVKEASQMEFADEARNANAHTNRLGESFVFVSDKVVDAGIVSNINSSDPSKRYAQFLESFDANAFDGDYTLLNAQTGLGRNYGEAISGRTNRTDLDERNAFQKLLRLGGQEKDSKLTEFIKSRNKFSDPYYSGNVMESMYLSTSEDGLSLDNFKEGSSRMKTILFGGNKALDADGQRALYGTLNESLEKSISGDFPVDLERTITDDDYLMQLFEKVAMGADPYRAPITGSSSASEVQKEMSHSLQDRIYSIYEYAFKPDQDGFMERKRNLRGNESPHPSALYAFFDDGGQLVDKKEDMRMLLEQFAVSRADISGANIHSGIFNTEGIDKKSVSDQLNTLRSITEIDYFDKKANSQDATEALTSMAEFRRYFKGDDLSSQTTIQESRMKGALMRSNPATGQAVESQVSNPLGQTSFLAIKKHQGLLSSINEELVFAGQSGEKSLRDNVQAISDGVYNWGASASTILSGRDGDITTATMGGFFFANRMDLMLQGVGLGLPTESKGSAAGIMGAQFATRILAPFMIYEGMKYVDGLTGDRISDTAADTYVNMHMDVNRAKEKIGINAIGRNIQSAMPWLDQLGEVPTAKVFNMATLGAFSDFRSGEDLQEYYESGEDAIRKGRYWGIGSNTPWMGGRIQTFEPNWYRKMKSDYMFSENVYGSEKEYWSNHWMPTPTNPLAPVKHFLTDPYHYEKKHAESRPYVITGGFNELSNIPLIGPAVNSVVSGVLKPQRMNPKYKSAHQEYLTRENEKLLSSYAGMNAAANVEFSTGGIRLVSDDIDMKFVEDDGELNTEALDMDAARHINGRRMYAESVVSSISGQPIQSGRSGSSGRGGILSSIVGGKPTLTSTEAQQSALAQMNSSLVDARTVNRNDQVSRAGTVHNPSVVQNHRDVINQQSLFNKDGVARDIAYSMGEFGGMYGFLGSEIAGFDQSARGATLESSSRFNSYNDSFWDMGLGGLGGDVSEIFRRFLPRDPNRNYYNPIKNTMPEWLPSQDYFIDFQHGDPYSKITKGEMRLPGEAYEKLFNVRKDAAGNYSAMDRYRILADVAPYSDQFRAAKKEMSIMNQNGILSDSQKKEYKQIREQVSAKSKKKNFYNERFENMDVSRQTVTVDKVIDQNTFTTLEHPNNPLKLAGVTVKADDEETKAIVADMIKPGQKLQVDLDNDPLRLVRDDMMDTMRAVVYAPHSAKGSAFGFEGLGKNQNLNYYLSQKESVSVKDDGSATSTAALYSTSQQNLGRFSDKIVHDVLPAIPIVNIITDKFLKVESPVEAYEKEVFSKSWRSWSNPISGWVQPMLDLTASKNPLQSAAHGMGIGALIAKNRWKGAWLGGLAFGTIAGGRTLLDAGNALFDKNDIWIPKRREKERDVDEYFDRLRYVKYKGLYAKAAEEAKKREGFDIDAYMDSAQEEKKKEGGLKQYLNTQKKWLTIEKKIGVPNEEEYDLALGEIREQLKEGEENREFGRVGAYTALALRYRDEYESTLYAAGTGETYDYNQIYRALPSKDKQYFTEFQKASPRERRRILQLVPDNQKPIYERYFGLKINAPDSNKKYFKDHNLPGEDWEGWDASHSLDNVKVKVMKQEGVELTEANFWGDDEQRAKGSGEQAIPMSSSLLSSRINQGDLEKVLRGAGLKDVRIQMVTSPSEAAAFSTNMNIQIDRASEVEQGMQEFLQYQ